jgi:hypothetical protein
MLQGIINSIVCNIIWPIREEIKGSWIKVHNKELHNLYSSDIIKVITRRWVGYVAHIGKIRNAYVFVQKPEWKRSFQRHKHKQDDNIKMDLKRVMVCQSV